GVDLLREIGASTEADTNKWLPARNSNVRTLIEQLTAVAHGAAAPSTPAPLPAAAPVIAAASTIAVPGSSLAGDLGESGVYGRGQVAARQMPQPTMALETHDVIAQLPPQLRTSVPAAEERVVRVTAQNLSRLMSLAGESLVEARWLQPFAKSLQLLKQNQDRLAAVVAEMHLSAEAKHVRTERLLYEARQRIGECRDLLSDRIGVFEQHARQSDDLSSRLYYEVIASRLRPFADGIQGFPRMVRDLARKLGKKIKFEIHGHNTDVDRDILEKLEAPLNHLLRNAVDHGLETPQQRAQAGKPEQGTLRLEARHRAGMLSITISDDGRGISLERLRRKVLEKGLSTPDLVASMNATELLDFLFLSGFSTAERVTEVSGRGVGLDVVQVMVSAVGGSVRVTSKVGEGSTFYLQLPITLSVMRAVLVTIGGEPYAFPHNRIDRLLRLPRSEIRSLEGRQYCSIDGRNVGLVMAQQVFDLALSEPAGADLCVVLISDHHSEFGVVVDRFQGELDLVVRPLDARLGKVANVSAAALLEDGSPVLIVDIEDFLRSINNLLQRGGLGRAQIEGQSSVQIRKRILVVDDSITVREAERALLVNRGYDVQVAVDGMDGWNTIRDGNFDLVVSDIDMPRMNGIEFVKNIKQDPRLKGTPVVIVSYKGREEDRLRGMDAGADYYLSKGSFHDDTLLDAVVDLIGEPE
ncbi:MAG: hybrid sensor histidine kinase/response regulator, partial [Planctomycetaceae bacterium]|nr:hybrid sensor histidine kinase/response regulator [Planctomycetaceae bacterium]